MDSQTMLRNMRCLISALEELKSSDPQALNINTRKDPFGCDVTDLLFITKEMRRDYEIYHDIVFINRRLLKTRFHGNLILICGINNEGHSIVFAVGLIKDDTQESFKFILDSFFNEISSIGLPQTVVIERLSQLKNAIDQLVKERPAPDLQLLYCHQHLFKSLKFQIKQLQSQRGLEYSENLKVLMSRVEKLPSIHGQSYLMSELEECKKLSLEDNIKRQCGEISIIVDKIFKEAHFWSRHITMSRFTGGINITERIEYMKLWMQRCLTKNDTSIDEAVRLLVDFNWLNLIQTPGMTQQAMNQIIGKQNSLLVDTDNLNEAVTYDEYKITKSHLVDQQPILNQFLKSHLTLFAVERCRYAIGQALKYFRVLKGEKNAKTFLIQHVNPNQAREQKQSSHQEQERRLYKVRVVDDYVFCSCMEYFNSGLPCSHQFFVGLKKHRKLLFHERWFKTFDKYAHSKPKQTDEIQKQNIMEQTFVYKSLLDSYDPASDITIEKNDIRILAPMDGLFSSSFAFRFGKSLLIPEGLRTFHSDKSSLFNEKDLKDENAVVFYDDKQKSRLQQALTKKATSSTVIKPRGRSAVKGDFRSDNAHSAVGSARKGEDNKTPNQRLLVS
ncbi:hypothetical protein FGO68_gene15045 [Halteria grandinella]|uniref:SWIM-type domain-containing protein n=1 Tax=Halteria grandinella TaxID=5974 RepID=A0A8J8P1N2_HALGN|nr:hypothetical protein FGO68_gene15045 [Halteria grandinella]